MSWSFLHSSSKVPYFKYSSVLWSYHWWSCLWDLGRKHSWSWLWWWKSDCEWSEDGKTQRYCDKQWCYPSHWWSLNSWFWSVMCMKSFLYRRCLLQSYLYSLSSVVIDKHGESRKSNKLCVKMVFSNFIYSQASHWAWWCPADNFYRPGDTGRARIFSKTWRPIHSSGTSEWCFLRLVALKDYTLDVKINRNICYILIFIFFYRWHLKDGSTPS